MVLLIPKQEINKLNIDTVERAIVFSALALRMVITRSLVNNKFDDAVKISTSQKGLNEVDLRLDVTLPFDPYKFVGYGGVLFSSLKELETTKPEAPVIFNFTVPPSNISNFELIDYPDNLPRSFESYFFFYASILYASLTEKRNQIIKINPKGTAFDGAEVKISITFPIDATLWGLGESLIGCVQRITDNYLTDFTYLSTVNEVSALNNNLVLDNELLLIN